MEQQESMTAMSMAEPKRAIEAILMVSSDPAPAQMLAQLLELPVTTVEDLCRELAMAYDLAGHGFQLVEVAGGWRYQTHPDLHPYVERYASDGLSTRLSSAALETLAIVAYKQPISRAQVSAIRGVNVDAVLRTLSQRGYVEEVGRDLGAGQAVLFGTTQYFLERVGINETADLPSLGEFVPSAEVVEALEQTLKVELDPIDTDIADPPEGEAAEVVTGAADDAGGAVEADGVEVGADDAAEVAIELAESDAAESDAAESDEEEIVEVVTGVGALDVEVKIEVDADADDDVADDDVADDDVADNEIVHDEVAESDLIETEAVETEAAEIIDEGLEANTDVIDLRDPPVDEQTDDVVDEIDLREPESAEATDDGPAGSSPPSDVVPSGSDAPTAVGSIQTIDSLVTAAPDAAPAEPIVVDDLDAAEPDVERFASSPHGVAADHADADVVETAEVEPNEPTPVDVVSTDDLSTGAASMIVEEVILDPGANEQATSLDVPPEHDRSLDDDV